MGKIYNKIVKYETKNFKHLRCPVKLEVEIFEHLFLELIKKLGYWVDGRMVKPG